MPARSPVDNTIGAALIGTTISSILYGVTCLQVYTYYTENAGGDRLPLRLFVAALTGLETLHLSLLLHMLYVYMVTNFVKACAFMSTLNSRKTVRAIFDESTRGAGGATHAQVAFGLSDLHMGSIASVSPHQSGGEEDATNKATTQTIVYT
ncbi:hypothetical protein AURDEDRAFT_160328 [Auricularia subglabra TFB-10046 SS5]|nr:hypothetical protein AURDEDRAFT_160328 [Auricularia subglabra TFB-10046 SS5]